MTSTVMPQPAVTLTFDLLTRKPNQNVSRPRYIYDVDMSLVKLVLIVTMVIYMVFWVSACCDLDLSPFDPQIYSAHL